MFNSGLSKAGRIAAVLMLSLAVSACSEMLSREDFAARVKDKSDKEVVKSIGKPAQVEANGAGETWTYTSRTFNVEERNKFDSKSIVVFSKAASDGKLTAVDVKFE